MDIFSICAIYIDETTQLRWIKNPPVWILIDTKSKCQAGAAFIRPCNQVSSCHLIMRESFQFFVRSCILTMLQPLTDFCVARGVRQQDFADLVKRCFVLSAKRKLEREGRLSSISKISVMTGIQRPAVVNLLENLRNPAESRDFIARVIGQWSSDARFAPKRTPKKLSIEGQRSEFARLVSTVSTDLNPHTVRFELERLNLITVRDGYAHLCSPVYITQGDPHATMRLGAVDVADLLVALQENAFLAQGVPNLQARTEYDNIPDEALPAIRSWFLEAGTRFHERARIFLSKFDRDINRSSRRSDGRHRIVIGTYSRVETLKEDGEND